MKARPTKVEDRCSKLNRIVLDLLALRHRCAALLLWQTRDELSNAIKQFVDETRP